jgi:hypothetical protein
VKRPEEVNRVVAASRRRDGGTVGITTTRDGAGGFGKTTLATMVCADRRVWHRFSGWIYLVPVGRDVQRKEAIAEKVNYVIKLMTGHPPILMRLVDSWVRCWMPGRADCWSSMTCGMPNNWRRS